LTMAITEGKGRAMESLEIEDEDARQERLQSILEKMNASSSCKQKDNATFLDPRKTELPMPEATNQLLARVQAFLPRMEASNAILSQADPKSIDIEHVPETDDQYIEMNLGLGVFEDRKTTASHPHSDSDSDNDDSSSSSLSSSSSCDSEDDASDSFADIMLSPASRPIKPLPKRMQPRPKIEELGDHPSVA